MERLCGGRSEGERRAARWFGRRQERLSLGRLGTLVGMVYAAVGQAASRFGKRLMKEAKLRGVVQKIESEIVKC